MVSLKTKNTRTKRLFLIALFIFGGSTIAFSAKNLFIPAGSINSVKDNSIVLEDALSLEEGKVVDNIGNQDDKPVITTYVVKNGDSLSSIASQFSISINTILWANDLNKKSPIKPGQKLTILPVSGVVYAVGKGDTLSGISLKFDADVEEIVSFNDLEDSKPIKIGMKLIIPNAELPLEKPAPVAKKETAPVTKTVSVEKKVETKEEVKPVATDVDTNQKTVIEKENSSTLSEGYFTHPIPGSVLTQGAHGYNSVDFGAPVGTPVLASAKGKVIVAKPTGYNGGYGKYIVVEHDNGTQTLYAHLSSVLVVVDDEVKKGEKIALSGNTGRSTGPHLHFEVRGGTNPWVGFKKLTQF
jgi:murein DD-endopeptidase MepM/ murein hydrolase activator NlpD